MRIGIGNHNSKPVYRVGILPMDNSAYFKYNDCLLGVGVLNKSVTLLPPFDYISQLPL